MKKEIEAFVNAANEQELEAAWNNLSAEEQRVFEQLMEEDSPEDALAFFAQLYDDAPKEQASETVSISEKRNLFQAAALDRRAEETQLLCGRERQPPCQEPVRFLDSGTDHHGESRSHHLHRDRQL